LKEYIDANFSTKVYVDGKFTTLQQFAQEISSLATKKINELERNEQENYSKASKTQEDFRTKIDGKIQNLENSILGESESRAELDERVTVLQKDHHSIKMNFEKDSKNLSEKLKKQTEDHKNAHDKLNDLIKQTNATQKSEICKTNKSLELYKINLDATKQEVSEQDEKSNKIIQVLKKDFAKQISNATTNINIIEGKISMSGSLSDLLPAMHSKQDLQDQRKAEEQRFKDSKEEILTELNKL